MAEKIVCKSCKEELMIEEYLDVGDIVVCDECGEEYLIKKTYPLKLAVLAEEDEA